MTASRLIVNADDLGLTSGVNAGIFEAHRRGIVSSASLMVAGAQAESAAAALADHPELGVGLHLALSGLRPVLPPFEVPSLVDGDGRLPPRPDGLGAAQPAEIAAEMKAQLQRFRDLTGRRPTHLDSHHHSHRLPALFVPLATLARDERLPVRCAAEWMRPRLGELAVATTDAFVEELYGDGADLGTLLRLLARVMPGTTELMCHPGRVDAELRRTSSYVEGRQRELEALTDPRAVAAVDRLGIELVHFGQLEPSHDS